MALCLMVGGLIGQVERGSPTLRRRLEWLSSDQASGLLLMGGAILGAATLLLWTMSRSLLSASLYSRACFGGAQLGYWSGFKTDRTF